MNLRKSKLFDSLWSALYFDICDQKITKQATINSIISHKKLTLISCQSKKNLKSHKKQIIFDKKRLVQMNRNYLEG